MCTVFTVAIEDKFEDIDLVYDFNLHLKNKVQVYTTVSLIIMYSYIHSYTY